ncbi:MULTISPECIES: endonuclease/exonuclease/phosphatase family protein [Serratia]|uniref:endonuclease/exonuclease/phosphatase family protein n=1 Tax=Serratia TaxID=613 RepID=UPI002DBA2AAE|nr:endonuclease/exonuclease/phosphatase family protein [Serratia ureilytica]MEB7893204.1 hypothetical protein [Serratia ureilytica]BEM96473.1 hypothetical protein SMEM02_12250 [Serratia marcescens]
MEDIVSIAWWNTGISPSSARNRMSKTELTIAFNIIADVLAENSIDIFCLGEVSPLDVERLSEILTNRNYFIYNGTYNEGKIKHDMCIIINERKLKYIDSKSITEQTILGKIRAGQEIQLVHQASTDSIFLYISHWPSRDNDSSQGMPKRYELGKTLRNAIDRCIEEKKGEYLILIGDYNDEPFDDSLASALGASRDRESVKRKDSLFYNPFWNHMGAMVKFPINGHDSCSYGTYYYKSGVINRWHTFDQMIFSSSFLRSEKWSLIENNVRIINKQSIVDLIKSRSNSFDHLPIVASIKRA